MAEQQAKKRAAGRQDQPLEQRLGEQRAPRCPERAHHRQIVAPLLHRVGERDQHAEPGARHQQQAEGAHGIEPDADQHQQARRFQGGRGGLQRALLVDQARQLHRAERRAVAQQQRGDLERPRRTCRFRACGFLLGRVLLRAPRARRGSCRAPPRRSRSGSARGGRARSPTAPARRHRVGVRAMLGAGAAEPWLPTKRSPTVSPVSAATRAPMVASNGACHSRPAARTAP